MTSPKAGGYEFAGPAVLFVPADRPDRYAKAIERADVVVVDLEDAVAPENKAAAREHVVAATLDPARTVVRINGAQTPWFADDLAAVARSGYPTVMLPKAESRAQVESIGELAVFAVCETPRGVYAAGEIAGAPQTVAMICGVEDLVGAIGGSATQWPSTEYRDLPRYARSAVMIAARAHGKSAVDTVYLDIDDQAGQEREARDAAATGFDASCCIHPSQVPIIRAAYAPPPERIDWARRVLSAAADTGGVFQLDGRMVDAPVFRQAESVLARHAWAGRRSGV